VNKSNLVSITSYIQNQREYHCTKPFKEEFQKFLDKNNLTYDETYLWD